MMTLKMLAENTNQLSQLSRDIQRTVATAHKLKKGAKVELTHGGYVVQTTSPAPA